MKLLLLITVLLTASTNVSALSYRMELKNLTKDGHRPLTSYSRSRMHLMQQIHIKQDQKGYFVQDVYCQKIFRRNISPTTMPNHAEINVEHTWPQSRFTHKHAKNFQKADLHHLYPTDSKANSTRGNHTFSEIVNGRNPGDNCDVAYYGRNRETGSQSFEPPHEHKGNVARAIFYFSIRYDIKIPDHEEFYLRQWNELDPVDLEEMERNAIIESIQGNRNPFIDDAQYADLIDNF
jgi:deoxyribonuclease-1